MTGSRVPVWPKSRAALQRRLLVSAFLADELDAGLALGGRDLVGRAAFAAGGIDAGVALLDDDGLAFHRLADQPLGLFTHCSLVDHDALPKVTRVPKDPCTLHRVDL